MTTLGKAIVVRLVSAIVVVWAAVSLLFVVFHVLPGNGADAILSGSDRIASQELRERTIRQWGLDQPTYVQYGKYWQQLAHGNFGTSFAQNRPVSSLLAEAAPASLRLAFWALVLEVFIGIGIAGYACRHPKLRSVVTAWSVVAIALPVFVLGYVLQLLFGVLPATSGMPAFLRLEVQGVGDDNWWFVIPLGSQWRYLVLPAVTLAVVSSAILARLTINGIRSAEVALHVHGARARGIPERLIFRRHVLRNALVPLLTFVGADLVALFGSAVLTESVFNWPGIGSVVAEAMGRQDVPVVLGTAIVLAAGYVAVNAFVDIVYRLIDPRLEEAL